MATAQVLLERGRKVREITRAAEEIFEREFSALNLFCRDLSHGKYPVC
jgi:S-adenosylmethionine synthetase